MVNRAEPANAIGEEASKRLNADLRAALRRRPAQEPRLSGVLRALAPHSGSLGDGLLEAFQLLVKRASFDRPLYAAAARAAGELPDHRGSAAFKDALLREDSGSFVTLSAVCKTSDPALADALAKVARSRHAHLAFAAEIARVARGESTGAHGAAIAPKIKESHRIALCLELFVPLSRARPLAKSVAPALAMLREAERHLGRWLVLAEVATRAGDTAPLAEARRNAADGPTSSRAAWAMVAWALARERAAPAVRPTLELVARLSDRPSADRDTTFLFRLAASQASAARPILEGLAKSPLADEAGVRAAMHLARDYGEGRLLELLRVAATSPRREAVRGLAAAALYDAGDTETARNLTDGLVNSRNLASVAWGALIRVAHTRKAASVVDEPSVRRIQFGWTE